MRSSSHRFDRSGQARIWAAGLVLVESVTLLGAAGLLVVLVLRGSLAADPGPTAVLVLLAVALAFGLAAASRSLARGGRGGRAPVITWQLLQAATAITLLGAPAARVGAVVALVLALAVLAAVVLAGPPNADAPVTRVPPPGPV